MHHAADARQIESSVPRLRLGEIPPPFRRQGRARWALTTFAYWTAFYALFTLYVTARSPWWLFAGVGFCLYVRAFDAIHEELHTRHDGSPVWDWLKVPYFFTAPFQLGYPQLSREHRQHHAYDGTERDPDLYLQQGRPWRAFLRCVAQPELALVRHVRAHGVDRVLLLGNALSLSFFVGLALAASWQQFALYNGVVRLASAVSWFVFTYVLHHPRFYRGPEPLAVPGWLRAVWLATIGRNNLNAITYHFLHHSYGQVPARELPAFYELVRDRGAASAEMQTGSVAIAPP